MSGLQSKVAKRAVDLVLPPPFAQERLPAIQAYTGKHHGSLPKLPRADRDGRRQGFGGKGATRRGKAGFAAKREKWAVIARNESTGAL